MDDVATIAKLRRLLAEMEGEKATETGPDRRGGAEVAEPDG
jgi:hypothetical protein